MDTKGNGVFEAVVIGILVGALVGLLVGLLVGSWRHGNRIKRLEDAVFPPAVEQAVGVEEKAE
jgi:hypothetical protein